MLIEIIIITNLPLYYAIGPCDLTHKLTGTVRVVDSIFILTNSPGKGRPVTLFNHTTVEDLS